MRSRICLVVLSLGSLAPMLTAQATYKSSPPAYQAKEGENSSPRLGGFRSQRVQLADGNYSSKGFSFKEISLRRDYWFYDGDSDGAGRQWNKVTVSVADTNIGSFQTTFSKNYASTPTQVFSAKVIWPTLTGLPTSKPAAIGGVGLTFPFSKSYTYSGTKDLLTEYVFDGGSLLNTSDSWGANDWRFYSLDADNFGPSSGGRREFLGSDKCVDSSQTTASLCQLLATVNSTGTMDMFLITNWTAGDKPVLKVVGLNGTRAGVSVGTCQKLYANPVFFFLEKAFSNGFHSTVKFGITYNSNWAGAALWSQAAYDDSKSGAFSLTRATILYIPAKPVTSGRSNKSMHAITATATVGSSAATSFSEVPLQFFK